MNERTVTSLPHTIEELVDGILVQTEEDDDSLDVSTIHKEKSELLEEVRKVKDEIQGLEEKISFTRRKKRMILSRTTNTSSGSKNTIQDDRMDIDEDDSGQFNNAQQRTYIEEEEKNYSPASIKRIYETDDQIKRLASFTKIKFTKISNSLVSATNINNDNEEHVLRRYTYFGTTYGLTFSLIFDVDETNVCVKKTWVNVGFGAKSELGKFIEFVERENNIHLFFKGLISYARLNQQRTRLFEALERKYRRSLLVSSSSSTNNGYLESEKKRDFDDSVLDGGITTFLRFNDMI
ncbi:13508_t:CDS:2, partial [Ambispora leptoticha]